MKIKGADLKRIIKEEILRNTGLKGVGRILKEETGVTLDMIDAASQEALQRKYGRSEGEYNIAGTSMSQYKFAWSDFKTNMKFMANLLPEDADKSVKVAALAGSQHLGALGSRHPKAPMILRAIEEPGSNSRKARMIFVILGGGNVSASQDSAGSHYLGLDFPRESERAAYDEEIKFVAGEIIADAKRLASTDIVAQVEDALRG